MEEENSDDFWLRYRPVTSPGKSLFYRYEHEGIIVYDSSARIFDEPAGQIPVPDPPKPRNKHDVIDADEYDISQYLNMKTYSALRTFPYDYTLVIPDDSLRFNSKFESGNLKKAIKISHNEYNLLLECDTETLGYTQWFYFSINNRNTTSSVRFNILNFVKYDSLYNKGMKPLVFSEKQIDKGWTRDCSAVAYYKNSGQRLNNRGFYTLTFSYSFKERDDQVFFAYSFPYTYTELIEDLEKFQLSEFSSFVRVNTLCYTLAGNTIPLLTVTKNVKNYTPWEEELEKLKKSAAGRRVLRIKAARDKEKTQTTEFKRCIFLTARVHPGETNGSYMMKGFLKFITGNSMEAKQLRKNFVFKIIPMLNPDGVIYGNYRCSLLGVDLNRRWKKPNKILHPEIYYCKRLIQMLSEEKEITIFCDMHGHSIKKDVFVYGCKNLENPKQDMLIKILPFLLSKQNRFFSYKKSIFRVARDKISTGRAVCFQDIHILNSYTLEASFFGPSCKAAFENKDFEPGDVNFDKHFEIAHLEKIGKDFGKVLVAVTSPKEFNRLIRKLCDSEEKFVSGRAETEEVEVIENEETFSASDRFSNFGSFIDESVKDELCISEEGDSRDCSDSEGSENDDKKVIYKKKIMSRKVKIREQKSVDADKEKVMRKTVTSFKKRCENVKTEYFRDLSSSYKRNREDLAKVFNPSPDITAKIQENAKVSERVRPALKFAAAVMLPRESMLFRGSEISRSLHDRRARVERYKKPEINSTKIKFKEVMMFVEDKKSVNNFKYII